MNLRKLQISLKKTKYLGEWDSEGVIMLFKASLKEKAKELSCGKDSGEQVYKCLFALTLFHELYHAAFPRANERQADEAAWRTYLVFYGKRPIVGYDDWMTLPMKRRTKHV